MTEDAIYQIMSSEKSEAERIEAIRTGRCFFERAWIGICGAAPVERDMCAEHAPLACRNCGAPAVRGCYGGGTMGCGAPICAACPDCVTSAQPKAHAIDLPLELQGKD